MSRKEGRRGIASIKNYLAASIRGLKDYMKKRKERLITAANNISDNIRTKRTATKTRKNKWEDKQLNE